MNDDQCERVVHSADSSSENDPMDKVIAKVKSYQSHLKSCWNKYTFGNVRQSLDRKRKLLAKANAESMSGRNAQVKTLSKEVNKLMDMEDCLWN